MLLSKNKIVPPSNWEHDPTLRNKDKNTVAMLLSYNSIIPPK